MKRMSESRHLTAFPIKVIPSAEADRKDHGRRLDLVAETLCGGEGNLAHERLAVEHAMSMHSSVVRSTGL